MSSFVVVAIVNLLLLGQAASQAPQTAELTGKWRLVVLYFAEDPFVIFEFSQTDGQLEATSLSAQRFLGNVSVRDISAAAGRLRVEINTLSGPSTFQGKWDAEEKVFKGTFRYRGTVYPAVLEPTNDRQVGALGDRSLLTRILQLRRQPPEQRVQQLREIIRQHEGKPYLSLAYQSLLSSAGQAGLEAKEVKDLIESWIASSIPYGPAWTRQVRTLALEAISGTEAYANITLDLGLDTWKSLPEDSPTEEKAQLARIIAEAAKAAGKADLHAKFAALTEELNKKLDEEYLAKIPPFEPERYKGRPEPGADRVVLLELFTGAECPPCVAADVAFDALLESFEPTELIALQYHLHIPGPDPLTNSYSERRSRYYGVRGTPSTYFNGRAQAGGGGPMSASKAKYDQYRAIIEPILYNKKQADITLDVGRAGDDVVRIAASARIPEGTDAKKPVLRLFLVERTIRYPGGNKVRFHHNVVRYMPGGANGYPMADGEVDVTEEVSIEAVRDELNKYLQQARQRMQFRHGLPPLELDDLAVVAIVQDDETKEVLHAVWAEVPPAQAGGE